MNRTSPSKFDPSYQSNSNFQSSEEIEEILLQELESLFDKPCLIPVQNPQDQNKGQNSEISQRQNAQTNQNQGQQPIPDIQTQFKVGFEKDYTNTFLVTNPQAIFKVFAKEQFLQLSEASQCILLDRLDDILQKCQHNSLILTDHIVLTNITRLNQNHISDMMKRSKERSDEDESKQDERDQIHSIRQSNSKQFIPEHDILMLTIQLCLKTSGKNPGTTKKLIELIRKLTYGKRFLRCHLEFIYQYLKIRSAKLCKNNKSNLALSKVDTSLKILIGMFEQRFETGPQSYFYFSGFLSGVQVNTKTIIHSEFIKLQDNAQQDDKNLPVLFNVFFSGHGGFECYFNGRKLFYRMLGRVYNPPREFIPKKWYFFATEHEKPSFTRPQFTAIINDKQVATLPLDYPKIDKNAKISLIAVCKNFVGLMSCFLLFKEPVNNMHHNFEYGFYSNQQFSSGKGLSDIFDQKIQDKLLILYCPERTSDLLRAISLYQEYQGQTHSLDAALNDFLKLVNALMSSKSYSQFEQDQPTPFFSIMFHLISKLPPSSVNNQTIQLLAEIRFQIGDSKLQEQFFASLMQSSDFWLNTDNIEVINEFWQFIKAIYSQNPIQYNKIFSIQNLIDLMVKISDIKDAGHCCEYHRNTYMMFYQGQIQQQQRTSKIGGIIPRERTSSISITNDQNQASQIKTTSAQRNINAQQEPFKSNIHQIDRYLAPIAGVLEGVLTSGGNEVLQQIQFIAKSLTLKSSPCFHLHMLKLLKVLLLDSKEGDSQHCASPGDFAAYFLKANGMQVLLYLCSNSSFDVKAMCVKLIDVLSSHTSLIKMAIDPDVITYLCNFILPRSMMDMALLREKSQIFKNISGSNDRMLVGVGDVNQNMINQYEMMESNEDTSNNDDEDLEKEMNELIAKDNMPQKAKKFGSGLFIQDDEEDEQEDLQEQYLIDSVIQQTDINLQMNQKKKNFDDQQITKDDYDPFQASDYMKDEDLLPGTRPPPPAPRSKGRGKTMQFDFDDSDKSQQSSKQKFNQTSKAYIFGKGVTIDEVQEDEDELKSQSSEKFEDELKDYGIVGFNKNFAQNDKKMQFMNTQKLPSFQSKTTGMKGKALALTLDESDDKPFESKRNMGTNRNTFTLGNNKKTPAIQFAEVQEDDNEDWDNQMKVPKKKDSFANENIMSKSNLRQPKSFNFGFPDSDEEEEEKLEKTSDQDRQQLHSVEVEDDIAEIYRNNKNMEQIQDEELFFNDQTFSKDNKKKSQLNIIGGQKKGSSVLIQSNNQRALIEDTNEAEAQTQQESIVQLPKKKKNLFLGGTTGATQDNIFEETPQQIQEQPQPRVAQQSTVTNKKAVISFQRNDKIFTNANLKLNIDTDAINELFTYGGEQGQVKMSEDEEIRNYEAEIEELATMCIAAMNRKKPTDPIKYENKTKQSFESKYLEDGNQDQTDSKKKGILSNPRSQFMTPQSVRGIKKIEFQMSQEEKNAVLDSSKEKINLGGTLGSQGLSTSKAFGLRSGMFSNNTILEELSPNSNSKSSSSKHDFNFAANSSSDPFQVRDKRLSSNQLDLSLEQKPFEEFKAQKGQSKKSKKPHQHMSFNQTQPLLAFTETLEKDIISKGKQKSSKNIINKHFTNKQLDANQIDANTDMFDNQLSKNNDDYTQELENLYTSCLEWIISRAPSSLYEQIVIDEVDKIGYQPAIQLLMNLVTYSNNIIRQRALNDLEMLAKWDPSNGSQLMVHPQFHQWLLEILMPYQDLTSKFLNLQGTSRAVFDIGCKLHTLLIKNACTNSEEEAYKRINFLARWPSIVKLQVQNSIKDRSPRDIQISNKLTRTLIRNLLYVLKEETYRVKPQIVKNYPTWQNMIYTIFLVEELVFSSHQKIIVNENFESNRDVNVSLLKWIQNDYLLTYDDSNERSLWAEWEILEQVFQIIDVIYPDWISKQDSKSAHVTIEELIFNTLEKCSADEFTNIVDVLMHEGSPYKTSQAPSSQGSYPNQKPQSKAKGLLSGVLGNKSHQQQQQQIEQIPPQQQANINSDTCFMKVVLNLLCIALTQSDTKGQVQEWLEKFEKFIKYIMILSETWKSRLLTTVYNNYQKKFSDSISFAFTFLFHEIHHTNSSNQRYNFNLSGTPQSNTSSPKEQMFNKLYAQCLKNLMIYYINIIEFQKIRFTPNQLESHITACRHIFNSVLIKSYQGSQDGLISLKDISRFKHSDYEDFPECFYMEDWKYTFFNSDIIRGIVKRQINHQLLASYQQRRKNYAQYYLDTQSSNEKTKDEILKRMQGDTVEVISQLSTEEFERKNKVALMNENFMREQSHNWKKVKQSMFSNRGIWRVNHSCEEGYLKSTLFKGGDGVRPIMKERFKNGFELIEPDTELEKKIFEQVEIIESYEIFNVDQSLIAKGKQQQVDEKKRKDQKPFGDGVQGTNSDEDELEKDEDEEEFGQHMAESSQQPIISFFSRPLTTRDKISLRKQYITHLKEYIYSFRVKTKEIISDLKVSILKPLYQKPGTITLTSHDIIFFDDLFTPANQQQERDNIFFFKYQKKNDDLLYKIIPLHNLKEIQRRRFLGRKTGLEIFMTNNKSMLLNFQSEEDRNTFATKIIRQRNQRSYNLKYSDSLEPRRILKKRELTEKWTQWKMSNFDYLMQLNFLSGRSFNDLSQYPVFPWILIDLSSSVTPDLSAGNFSQNQIGVQLPPQGFRDLNKNMQLLGTAERQAEFKRKYDDQDSFASDKEKFHCGSHYSNPGIVLHFLSRLSPYIDALVELHGKNLDTPDRGFHSVQDSLNSALTDHADVRELVPEFYFCPEMFMNLNKIKFGTKQDGTVVNDLLLPQWCNNDPYLFVIFMREAFESNYVSQNLSSWIDYIFGYKQKDQEAERSLNLFSHITYEDGIDIENVQDPLMKQSYQEQIYNYGQTPSQLFQKNKHPNKIARQQSQKFNVVVDNMSKIKVYKPVNPQQAKGQSATNSQAILLSQEAILKAKFIDDQTIVGVSKDGTVTYFFWLSKAHELNPNTPFTCCEDKKRKYDNKQKYHGIETYDRSIKKFDFPLLILNNFKCILRGGFWGGKIQICPIEGVSQESTSYLTSHNSSVTVITSTQNEKVIITGSKTGDVSVWIYIEGNGNSSLEQNWHLRKQMCDHEGMISTIHINEEMCLYMTCSFDGTANVYNLATDKFQRSFAHPKLAPLHCGILTQTPLPSCCLFSREDHYWQAFTLNGHFLDKQKEECGHIISPQLIKDSHFMDKLVYGTEKGYLIFRQLPLLKQFKKQQVSTQYPVLSIIVSPDRRFLLVGCGDGGLNVVTEPFQLNQGTPQVQSSNITSSNTQNSQSSISSQGKPSIQSSNNSTQSMASSFISTSQTIVNLSTQQTTQGYSSQTGKGSFQINSNQNYSSSGGSNQALFNPQNQYRE